MYFSSGRCGTNPTTDGMNSNEFFDTVLFPDSSNAYNNAFPMIDDTQSKVNILSSFIIHLFVYP